MQEGAGVHAVVDGIVNQPGVATHGDALPGSVEIRLGGHGVLMVAQVVADVGQQFDQGDAQIGHMALRPVGHGQRQPVEEKLAEGSVILGQIADLRLGARLRRTGRLRLAVKIAGAIDHEAERGAGVARVEAGVGVARLAAALVQFDDAQLIGRKVAALVNAHVEVVVLVVGLGAVEAGRDDGDVANAPVAAHAQMLLAQPARRFAQEEGAQQPLLLKLHVVQPVQRRLPHGPAALFIFAYDAYIHSAYPTLGMTNYE